MSEHMEFCGCALCSGDNTELGLTGAVSGVRHIDALLATTYNAAYRWNALSSYGTAVDLTFSFMEQKPSYYESIWVTGPFE